MVSLMEQHGYSEEDMLLCKLCQKEEIERLLDEIKVLHEHYDPVVDAARLVAENVTPENWCELQRVIGASQIRRCGDKDKTRRILEDLTDRACRNDSITSGIPKSLSGFTDWLRGLYPELYSLLDRRSEK